MLEWYVYKKSKSWLKTLIMFASPQLRFQKKYLSSTFHSFLVVQATQYCGLAGHLAKFVEVKMHLPDKIHYEKDWVLTTNCADQNTRPLPGTNLVSRLVNVNILNKLHRQSVHDDTPNG